MKSINWLLGFSMSMFVFSCDKKSTNDDNNVEQQLKKGLLAHYPFNGNANDETGNGYNLVVKGPVKIDNRFGDINKAYKFNGTSDVMIIPKISQADSLREFTISVWVYAEVVTHNSILSFVSKDPHLCSDYLGFDNNLTNYSTWHQIITKVDPMNCTSSVVKDTIGNPLNKWCHIVLVQRYNTTTSIPRYEYSQYLNDKKLKPGGSDFGSVPVKTSFNEGGLIGANNTSRDFDLGNFGFFKGGIDDIRIHNRALSDAEVSQLYNLHE